MHLALPLTVLHMPYTSYLDAAQHHRAAGSPHIARDVRLYLIRTWGSVSKTRKKEILTFIAYKNKKIPNKRIYVHIYRLDSIYA
jgi:hypothetical protein